MRLKDYDGKDGKKVWLNEDELSMLLENFNDSPEQIIGSIMMARCGLRRNEVTTITPADLVDAGHGQVIRVREAKGGKYREVFAPDAIPNIVAGMQLDADAPIVDVNPRQLYDWVRRAAEKSQAMTDDIGWSYLGPHDLRRTWGVRLLEDGVSPAVVCELGGWSDWETFRDHYLSEFSEKALREERDKIRWLGGTPSKTRFDRFSRKEPGRVRHR